MRMSKMAELVHTQGPRFIGKLYNKNEVLKEGKK